MEGKITRDVIESYIQCRYKAYLKLTGQQGGKSDYEMMLNGCRADLEREVVARILALNGEKQVVQETSLTPSLLRQGKLYLLGVTLATDDLELRFDALKKAQGTSRLGEHHYAPAIFHECSTVKKEQKLLLQVHALLLSRVQGRLPSSGVIFYGDEHRSTRPRITPDLQKANRLLSEIRQLQAPPSPPTLLLNDHCSTCEFRELCRSIALEEDNLSLLRSIGKKEMQRYSRKGILTLTQLSHIFRPRRKGKRSKRSQRRYHALQAKAIRDRTIYVLGTPEVPDSEVKIYLDCEGDPRQGLVYLIGVLVVDGSSEEKHSFWADSEEQEPRIFEQFLKMVSRYEDAIIFCYGGYEKTFFRRMRKKAKRKRPVDKVLGALQNALSQVYSHVYFPCYSNGLKEIGEVMGYTWSEEDASGIQSVVWRREWETTRDEELKQRLITYNLEDCAALRKVTEFLSAVNGQAESAARTILGEDTKVQVTSVQEIDKLAQSRRWGEVNFFHADYEHINKCAYFDYQKHSVRARANSVLRKKKARKGKRRNSSLRVTRYFKIEASRCPSCKSTDITRDVKTSSKGVRKPRVKRCFDLAITPSGIRRQVFECRTSVHRCEKCGEIFVPDRHQRAARYFHGLRSWAMYHHVAHRTSFGTLTEMCEEQFGLGMSNPEMVRVKPLMAHYYRPTYRKLLKVILSGKVMHVDETYVKLRSGKRYVWVFAGQEEVVYMYRPTRQADFLKKLMKDFQGVLVSDFYTAYDSFECPQQKCLIHLMRDINQDLLNNPYDEELQSITGPFGKLLRTVVETVDTHGLRHRHLKKHSRQVAKFFRFLSSRSFHSEAAENLRKRLVRYEDKLFTFIHHNDVAWNNNNAENAIKRFAYYRANTIGTMTETGLSSYLVMLSLYQTCRYKGVSFLKFLFSRERDLGTFRESKRRKRKRLSIEVYPKNFVSSTLKKRWKGAAESTSCKPAQT